MVSTQVFRKNIQLTTNSRKTLKSSFVLLPLICLWQIKQKKMFFIETISILNTLFILWHYQLILTIRRWYLVPYINYSQFSRMSRRSIFHFFADLSESLQRIWDFWRILWWFIFSVIFAWGRFKRNINWF